MAKVATRQSKRPREILPKAEEVTLSTDDMTVVLTAEAVAIHAEAPFNQNNYQFLREGMIAAEVKVKWNSKSFVNIHNQITSWMNRRV